MNIQPSTGNKAPPVTLNLKVYATKTKMAALLLPGSLALAIQSEKTVESTDMFQVTGFRKEGAWIKLTINDGHTQCDKFRIRNANLTSSEAEIMHAFVKITSSFAVGTGSEFRISITRLLIQPEPKTDAPVTGMASQVQIISGSGIATAEGKSQKNVQSPLVITVVAQLAPNATKTGQAMTTFIADKSGSAILAALGSNEIVKAQALAVGESYEIRNYDFAPLKDIFRKGSSVPVQYYMKAATTATLAKDAPADEEKIAPLVEMGVGGFEKDARDFVVYVQHVTDLDPAKKTTYGTVPFRTALIRDASIPNAYRLDLWNIQAENFTQAHYQGKIVFLGKFGYTSFDGGALQSLNNKSYFYVATQGPASTLRQWTDDIGLTNPETQPETSKQQSANGPPSKRTRTS